jgi:hypothetical protein
MEQRSDLAFPIHHKPSKQKKDIAVSKKILSSWNNEESDHEQENQINVFSRTGHWCSLRRDCFGAAVAERRQRLGHLWR